MGAIKLPNAPVGSERIEAWLAQKQMEFEHQFDPSNMNLKLLPYFRQPCRVGVLYYEGQTKPLYGQVNCSTGWQPVLGLAVNKRSGYLRSTFSNPDPNLRIVKVQWDNESAYKDFKSDAWYQNLVTWYALSIHVPRFTKEEST